MKKENFENREIDYNSETCPPAWCPLEGEPGCCHGCEFIKHHYINDEMNALYCTHPYAYQRIRDWLIN